MTHKDNQQGKANIWSMLWAELKSSPKGLLGGMLLTMLVLIWQIGYRRYIWDTLGANWTPFGPHLAYHVAAFVLLFAAPGIAIVGLRMTPKGAGIPTNLGFGLGHFASWNRVVWLAAPVAILIGWSASLDPQMVGEYPLPQQNVVTMSDFFLWECVYAIYYIGWEAMFRGYLLFGLAPSLGERGANAYQTAISCLVHLGKPDGELLSSLPGGYVFGLIAQKTGSIWPGFVIHWMIGAATDFFCWQAGVQ